MALDITPAFESIIDQLETGSEHLFITGKAGTGKSTLLQHFRASTQKKLVVLAPTGVAALNVQGQTIHSFFGFSPQVTPDQARKEHPSEASQKLIEELQMIIIDESSMLRADLLDAIDQALRQYDPLERPFGGKRMVFIGDLYQLPPVVTSEERHLFQEEYASPYFFDAKVFSDEQLKTLQLEKIYRQQDQGFIQLLNNIRENQLQDEDLITLNQRFNAMYTAFQKDNEVTLCTTNATARRINQEQLQTLSGKRLQFMGEVKGDFIRNLPSPEKLDLKIGAQVMLVNNDLNKRWVNGSTGVITACSWNEETECDVILVKLSDGKTVEVLPYTWETNNYFYDEDSNTIEMEQLGSYSQYPIKLAWAVTIHKSQGKTFDNVVLDIGRGTFAHGQIYVALSRCTSLEGLTLRQPLERGHIWIDHRIQHFSNTEHQGSQRLSKRDVEQILQNSIDFESQLVMTYTTSRGQTFQKRIQPMWIGAMEYMGREYQGLEAQDLETGESRSYSLKRIMNLEPI